MPPAEVLDAPRVLALKAEPAELVPGGEHALSALTFAVEGELSWSLCAAAWAPTEPLSCPTGAIALGRGAGLTVTMPAELESAWLKVEPTDGAALPAVKLLEAGSGATNPEVLGVVAVDGALSGVAPGAEVALKVDLGALSAAEAADLVVSWYVTAGELEPARTLGSESATLTAPESGEVKVVAVVREAGGGTAWAEATVTIGGAP